MSVHKQQSLNRSERRKLETRQRILDSAQVILERDGYANLTIKDVMEQADLGYGTFYGHFDTKEALVWTVFRGMSDQLMAAAEQESVVHSSPLREYIGWQRYFEAIFQFRELFGPMFGPTGNAELRRYYQDYMIEIVLNNLNEGVYHPAPMFQQLPLDYLARFVAGTQIQLTDWLVMPDCPYSPQEMATLLFRTIYHQAPPQDTSQL